MSTSATTEAVVTTQAPDEDFAAQMSLEYAVEKKPTGEVVVKDVPVFGENERKSFMGDVKYDAAWLKGAHKVDEDLRKGDYRAPMHFGHHTGMGSNVERAGHYEMTGVKKVKLHGKKLHVAFANLVFKNEESFNKYKSDYPYRSVEISHERPDQINSLALLSSEAPYFQFPVGNLKFATDLAQATEPPKAHYFAWKAEGVETFLSNGSGKSPPKSGEGSRYSKPAAKAGPAPKFGEGEPAGESDGADGMAQSEDMGQSGGSHMDVNSHNEQPGTNQNDVVVATLNAMMELLNKLVDHTLKKDGGEPEESEDEHDEPDGDEAEPDHNKSNDGDKSMSDKGKTTPVVAASAEVAALEGKVVALEAELNKMRKDRENDAVFASLKSELANFGIANLDEELRKRIDNGTAQAWASGIKHVAPTARAHEAPSVPMEAPEVAEFLKKNPKADAAHVRRLAADYAAAPEGHLVRKYPLDRYLAVQLEMGS